MPQITSKGQVTIPQDIRNRFALLPGTEVEIVVRNNRVIIRKKVVDNKFRKWLGRGKNRSSKDINKTVDQLRGRIVE